jgi:hypothetical protein
VLRARSLISNGLGRIWRLPPARNAVTVTSDLRVPMRDGVHLLADHYAPRSIGPRPTILVRCPYGRGIQFALTMVLPYARRGYHVLFQSTRGTFGSGGDCSPATTNPRTPRTPSPGCARKPGSTGGSA